MPFIYIINMMLEHRYRNRKVIGFLSGHLHGGVYCDDSALQIVTTHNGLPRDHDIADKQHRIGAVEKAVWQRECFTYLDGRAAASRGVSATICSSKATHRITAIISPCGAWFIKIPLNFMVRRDYHRDTLTRGFGV